MQAVQKGGKKYHKKLLKRALKKISKNFKKVLDKKEKVWYNSQAVREADSKRSLKIEQQERSTKHSMCERTNLVKELYILNKSKRS